MDADYPGLGVKIARRNTPALRRSFTDPAAVRLWVRETLADHPELLEGACQKLGWGAVDSLDASKKDLLCKFLEDSIATELPRQMILQSNSLDEVERDYSTTDGLRLMQSRPLKSAVSPPVRVERLRLLSWSVVELAPHTLILGDVGVLRLRDDGEYDIAFDAEGEDQLFLPLSHDRLLVGQPKGHAVPLDAESLNIAASELSMEFFVASCSSAREHTYHARLGARVESVFDVMLGPMLRK